MKTMPVACRFARLARASILFAAVAAYGAEIRVMTSGAFTSAYLELKSQFERATQDKVVTLATTIGTGPDFIPNRLQRGELVDVVIVEDTALDRLITDGSVVAHSKVPLGRSKIGMAVRAGAVHPDISSVDALKQTLLHAKSIAYSGSVSGDYLSTELFQRLGIADQIAPKSKRIERERVGAVVARGEAEIGFQQVSEILPIRGIDYVGPLPKEVQKVSVFSAGVAAASGNSEVASRFIRFLASPDAARTIARNGLEPIATTSATPTAFHLLEATIEDIHLALRSGQTTCRQLVELYLERVATYDKSGPRLNAVQTINPQALQEAERLDAALHASGPIGVLHCIPVLIKDQLNTSDMPTTYGSAVFRDFVPQKDATVVSKLRNAGAVIIGKATMGEFASGIAGRRRDRFGTPMIHGVMRAGLRGARAQASPPTSPRWASAKTRVALSVVPRRSAVWSASGPRCLSSVATACSPQDPAPTQSVL